MRITAVVLFHFLTSLRRADPCAKYASFVVKVWRNIHEPSFAETSDLILSRSLMTLCLHGCSNSPDHEWMCPSASPNVHNTREGWRTRDPKEDFEKRTIDDVSTRRRVIFAQHVSDGSVAPSSLTCSCRVPLWAVQRLHSGRLSHLPENTQHRISARFYSFPCFPYSCMSVQGRA